MMQFQKEAKATSLLNHPGIVKVMDFGIAESSAPYMVLEFVDGISLENQLNNALPDNIEDTPDDILNWAITCEITTKPFRIIPGELEFYRKHALPIPKRHPDQRHLDRMSMLNPRKLFERYCDKC